VIDEPVVVNQLSVLSVEPQTRLETFGLGLVIFVRARARARARARNRNRQNPQRSSRALPETESSPTQFLADNLEGYPPLRNLPSKAA
jgi:hypothetical protein